MKNVYLSHLAHAPLIEYLKSTDLTIHLLTGKNMPTGTGISTPVYDAVSTHADIHMCRLGVWGIATPLDGNVTPLDGGTTGAADSRPSIFMGDTAKLGRNYPSNIIYNAVCTERYFIHNLKYTDPALLDAASRYFYAKQQVSDVSVSHAKPQASGTPVSHAKPQFIDVPQGYTRCCCLPVDERSFITSDEGIAKALAAYDTDVLLISKGHIELPGFDYGFIGGCAGHLTSNEPGRCSGHLTSNELGGYAAHTTSSPAQTGRYIIFNGNLTTHPDHEKIAAFIEDRDIDIIHFKGYPLTDIGSILTG